jgi:hypothetical protein
MRLRAQLHNGHEVVFFLPTVVACAQKSYEGLRVNEQVVGEFRGPWGRCCVCMHSSCEADGGLSRSMRPFGAFALWIAGAAEEAGDGLTYITVHPSDSLAALLIQRQCRMWKARQRMLALKRERNGALIVVRLSTSGITRWVL